MEDEMDSVPDWYIDPTHIAKALNPTLSTGTIYRCKDEDFILDLQNILIKKWPDRIWMIWFGKNDDRPSEEFETYISGDSRKWGLHVAYYKSEKRNCVYKQVPIQWFYWGIESHEPRYFSNS